MTAPGTGPASSSRLRFILLVAAITVVPAVSMDLYLPGIPRIVAALEGTVAAGQLTVTLFFLGLAAGEAVAGTLADALGRRPVLLAALAAFVLATLACAFSTNMEALLAARLAQGTAAGGVSVMGRVMVRDRFEGAEMARVMSWVMSVLILGPMIAPVVGATLLEALGWRASFGFVAAYGLLTGLLVLLALRRRQEKEQGREQAPGGPAALLPRHLLHSYRIVLTHRRTLVFVAVCTLAYACLIVYLSSVSAIVITGWGWTPLAMSGVFATVAGCIALGGILNARLLRRLPVERMLRTGLAAGLLGGVAGAAASALLPAEPLLQVAAFCVSLLGFSLVVGNGAALAVQAHGARAGVASAVLGVVQMLGASTLGILFSLLQDGTALPVFLALAGFNLAALAILLADRKEELTP